MTLVVLVVNELPFCHLVMAKVALHHYFLAISQHVTLCAVLVDVFQTKLADFKCEETKVVPMLFDVSFYYPLRASLVQTMYKFELTSLFMSFKISIECYLRTSIPFVLAFYLEQVVHLMFEGNGDLHEGYTSTAQGTPATVVLDYTTLPTVDATFAESVATLIALARINQNVLANRTNKVGNHVLVAIENKSF